MLVQALEMLSGADGVGLVGQQVEGQAVADGQRGEAAAERQAPRVAAQGRARTGLRYSAATLQQNN